MCSSSGLACGAEAAVRAARWRGRGGAWERSAHCLRKLPKTESLWEPRGRSAEPLQKSATKASRVRVPRLPGLLLADAPRRPLPRRLAPPVGGVDRLERRRPPAVAVPAPVAGAGRRRDRAARRLRVLRDHAHGAAELLRGAEADGRPADAQLRLRGRARQGPQLPLAHRRRALGHAAVVQVRARPTGRARFPRTSPTAHSRTSTGATARRGWRRCAPTTARSTAPTSRAPSASRTRRRRRRRRRPSTRSARRWARCPWAR